MPSKGKKKWKYFGTRKRPISHLYNIKRINKEGRDARGRLIRNAKVTKLSSIPKDDTPTTIKIEPIDIDDSFQFTASCEEEYETTGTHNCDPLLDTSLLDTSFIKSEITLGDYQKQQTNITNAPHANQEPKIINFVGLKEIKNEKYDIIHRKRQLDCKKSIVCDVFEIKFLGEQ